MPASQYCSSFEAQYLQAKHESTMHPTPTTSPIAKPLDAAFLPTSVTVPMSSCPGTIGYRVFPKSFIAKCRSVWHIPQYAKSKLTSSSPTACRSTSIVSNASRLAFVAAALASNPSLVSRRRRRRRGVASRWKRHEEINQSSRISSTARFRVVVVVVEASRRRSRAPSRALTHRPRALSSPSRRSRESNDASISVAR